MMKKELLRKGSAVLATVTLMSSALTGCGGGKTKSDNNVTDIDWFVNMQQWTTSTDLWETAEVLKEAVKKTGVNPKITVPTGSGAEKINLMLASGDLPDLITFRSEDQQIDQMAQSNALWTFDELVEKFDPSFDKDVPDDVKLFGAQSFNGEFYGIPSFLATDWQIKEKDELSAVALMVRSDIYEELGSPDMTTPDGFYNALLKFKEKYPQINGKNSIPLSLWEGMYGAGFFGRCFGLHEFYIDENDNYYAKWKDPKFENYIKYMAKLNKAGLVDKEAYVKKEDQVKEELSNGMIFALAWNFDALYDVNENLGKQFDGARYKVIEPMNASGEEKVTLKDAMRIPWLKTVVPREAKKAKEATKFMHYLWSPEGNLLTQYGHEGEDYVRIDDHTIQRTDSYVERSSAKDFSEKTGIGSYGLFHNQWFKVLKAPSAKLNIMDEEDRPLANSFAGTDYVYLTLMKAPAPDSEEGLIITRANKIESEAMAKINISTDEEESLKIYRKMVKDIYALGYDKVDEFRSEQHKIAKQRYAEYEAKTAE